MTVAKGYSVAVAGLLLVFATCCLATLFDALPLFTAGLVLVSLMLLSCLSPEKMLTAFVACSILVPVDFAVKVGSLPRTGPIRLFLAALIAGAAIRYLLIEKRPLLRVGGWLPWSIGIFLLSAAISSLFSVSGLQSCYSVAGLVLEQYLLLYLLVQFVSTPESFKSLKFWIYLAASAVCIFALFEEVFQVNPFMVLYSGEEMAFRGGILRVRSVFMHPIALGCFVTLLLPFVATDLINSRSRLEACLLALLGFIMLSALFLTVSRGPWIALLLEAALFIGWWCWKSVKVSLFICVSLLAVGIGIFLVNEVTYNLSLTNSVLLNPNGISGKNIDESSSEYYRVALAKAVLDRVKGERVTYGYGPGTFHLAEVESRYAGHDHVLTAADSYYLKILFEHGMVGLLSFAAIMICILFRGCKALLDMPHGQSLPVIASLAIVLAFIFQNVTASMFSYSLPLTLIFWVAVASLINARRISYKH